MLISMPTDTSTIFGVFQVIRGPPNKFGTTFAPGLNLGPPRTPRKYRTSTEAHEVVAPDADISLLDKVSSLLDNILHDKGTRGAEEFEINMILNRRCSEFGLPASAVCGTLGLLSDVEVYRCQRRTRILIPSVTVVRCCDGWCLPGSAFLRLFCCGALD